MEYNQAQKTAITHVDGPCMVLAGPGSGKTTVITSRIQYLIETVGIHPGQILVITFTKAAALEMKERFQKIMQGAYASCTFGTFHSVFFMILRRAYGYQSGQVLAEEQKRQILKSIIQEMNLEYEDEEEFLQQLMQEITLVKSEYISIEHYYSTSCGEEEFRTIYQCYEKRLRQEHKIDFDDMLVYTYELLKERQDILAGWQQRFQYILIDEFQDINRIQYEVVKLLAGKRANLFIVGDDDQSIYRFRGAKPEIMLGFPEDYKGTKQVLLNVNYRSTREIVEGSLRMIQNNHKRYAKDIIAAQDYRHPVCIHEVQGIKEECRDILDKIRTYHVAGIPYEEMAIIVRTNMESRPLVDKLMEYNIPFRMRDKLPNCYEHWIARQLIAYIKIALGNTERANYLLIWNRPKRYLRREWLTEGTVELNRIQKQLQDKEWAVERIQTLQEDLEQLKAMTPYAAIQYIRKGIGYEEYIREYAQARKIKPDDLLDMLDELQSMTQPFDSYEAWFEHIKDYGERLDEQRRKQERLEEKEAAVTVTTMHSAKGLEYQVVFVPEANEGIAPHKKAGKPEEIEEERRMFYVAITRAKEYLHLYVLKERYHKPLLPSRFVNEIRLDKSALKTGARVRHKQYGLGMITYINPTKISLLFEATGQTKTFSLDYVLEQGLLSC